MIYQPELDGTAMLAPVHMMVVTRLPLNDDGKIVHLAFVPSRQDILLDSSAYLERRIQRGWHVESDGYNDYTCTRGDDDVLRVMIRDSYDLPELFDARLPEPRKYEETVEAEV